MFGTKGNWQFKWSNTHLNGPNAYVMFNNMHEKLNIIYTLEALEERIQNRQPKSVPLYVLQEAMDSLEEDQRQAA